MVCTQALSTQYIGSRSLLCVMELCKHLSIYSEFSRRVTRVVFRSDSAQGRLG